MYSSRAKRVNPSDGVVPTSIDREGKTDSRNCSRSRARRQCGDESEIYRPLVVLPSVWRLLLGGGVCTMLGGWIVEPVLR